MLLEIVLNVTPFGYQTKGFLNGILYSKGMQGFCSVCGGGGGGGLN